MKKYTIVQLEHVKIKNFKSISETEFDVDPSGLVIKGKNGLGKSNTLNAIYWCITGSDLNDNSQNDNFIPKTLREANGEVVDVEITLNVGKIRRVISKSDKGCTTKIFINDVESDTLKLGEAEIDKMLGILEYTLSSYTNKDFSMRKFALNPTYLLTLTPKAIRDVIVKRFSKGNMTKQMREILNNDLLLHAIFGKEIPEGYQPFNYNDLVSIDARLLADLKTNKAQIDKITTAIDVLSTLTKEDVEKPLKQLQAALKVYQKDNMVKEANEKIVANSILELEKIYAKRAKHNDPKFVVDILQTSANGNVKAGLTISSNEIEVKQRSTSESVFDTINFMLEYFWAVDCNTKLPIFIDKAESINKEHLQGFTHIDHQLLITVVNDEEAIIKENVYDYTTK